jgi:hypothetical protein
MPYHEPLNLAADIFAIHQLRSRRIRFVTYEGMSISGGLVGNQMPSMRMNERRTEMDREVETARQAMYALIRGEHWIDDDYVSPVKG